MPWEEVNLITIDNFKIPVKIQAEKIIINKYKSIENYVAFMKIEIQDNVI